MTNDFRSPLTENHPWAMAVAGLTLLICFALVRYVLRRGVPL